MNTITVPMRSMFVGGDDVCSDTVNIPIADSIPTHEARMTWTLPERSHSSIIGDNHDFFFAMLTAMLANSGEAITGNCSTIDFSSWN